MKVVIAGGRDFNNYDLLRESCDHLLSNHIDKSIEIVSGGAKGADYLGELYAIEKQYKVTKFMADWNTHGKKAGPIRNKEMLNYTDVVICFWDGKSKGTKNMITITEKAKKPIRIIKYKNDI